MENKNNLFLNLYRKLEQILESKYFNVTSPVKHYENILKSSSNYKKVLRGNNLELARQLRNILSHNEIALKAPFYVSDEIIKALEYEIKDITNVKNAYELSIKKDLILYAKYQDNLYDIIVKMKENGYSHVPILKANKVVGVISGENLFNSYLKYQHINLDNKTTVEEFKEVFQIDDASLGYLFVKRSTSYDELILMCERKNRKIKVFMIFVTENGRSDEALLGILTPYDLLQA